MDSRKKTGPASLPGPAIPPAARGCRLGTGVLLITGERFGNLPPPNWPPDRLRALDRSEAVYDNLYWRRQISTGCASPPRLERTHRNPPFATLRPKVFPLPPPERSLPASGADAES